VVTNYKILVEAFKEGLKALVPGKKCSEVYKAVEDFIKSKDEALASKLIKNLGSGIGLEFKESHTQLTNQTNRVLEAGNVLNFRIGFEGLTAEQATDPKDKQLSIRSN
jgi:nucleosome binding factor SPN SPT16 subunit